MKEFKKDEETLEEKLEAVQSEVQKEIDALEKKAEDVRENVQQEVEESKERIREEAQDLGIEAENVIEKGKTAAEEIKEKAEEISEAAQKLKEEAEEAVTDAADSLCKRAEEMQDSLKEDSEDLCSEAKEAEEVLKEEIRDQAEEVREEIHEANAFEEIKREEKKLDSLYQKTESTDGSYHYSYVEPKKETPVRETGKKKSKGANIFKKIGIGLCIFALAFGGGYAGSKFALKDYDGSTTVIYEANPTEIVYTNNGNESGEMSIADVTELTKDSVVEITTESVKTGYWMNSYIVEGAGSGVIISSNGYIVTCNHVIEDARSIKVRLTNGDEYEANLVGTDASNDIAVIKINAQGLPSATLGDSDAVRVGETVIAIGNPLGNFGGSVSSGILSAKDRNITVDELTMEYLFQITAPVSPGNSGGALFNTKGELIGIVNAKEVDTDVEGIGFAIPINNVKSIIEDLVTKGYVTGKRTIGIRYAYIQNAKTAEYYGLDADVDAGIYIVEIVEDSLAEELNFQKGDRIVSINGIPVNELEVVGTIYSNLSVGDEVKFVLERNGSEVTIQFNKD